MRASAAVTVLFLASGFASSVAISSIKSERNALKPVVSRATALEDPTNKAMAHEFVKALSSAVLSTMVMVGITSATTPQSRESLEHFHEQINQELSVRAYKRDLPKISLDNLD